MSLANGRDADSRPMSKLTTAELESEIGHSRRRIGLTLDALAQRLAPRRLLQKGTEMASRFAGTMGRKRSATGGGFRLDPLALGLIGAGIAWLVTENARGRRRKPKGAIDTPIAGRRRLDGLMSPAEPAPGAIEAHPLLLGLAGLALGAALAAVLPSGRGERETIARAREELWQKAEALGHRAAARIRDAGRGPRASPPPSGG